MVLSRKVILVFLERAISSQNKPLYIVLNKADRRTSDDWKDVLNEAREILDDYDIPMKVSAYTAQTSIMNTPITNNR